MDGGHLDSLGSCRSHLTFFIISLGYFDFTYNVQPETTETNHWQTIGDYQQPKSGAGVESTVKGYDEKYNIGEAEEFEAQAVRKLSMSIMKIHKFY